MSILLLLLASNLFAGELKKVDDFQAAAAKANAVLTVPNWEQKPEAMNASIDDAIRQAKKSLDDIGALEASAITFKNTLVALDELIYQADLVANRASVIKETTANPALRAAAEQAVKTFQDWAVSIPYREDVYKSVKAFANAHPKLSGEDEKLLNETLLDYHRAGMDLPSAQRNELEQWRKELSKAGADFETNITSAQAPVIFTKDELDGMPESFFASPGSKTSDKNILGGLALDLITPTYKMLANDTGQYNLVEENVKSEATRKKLYVARETLAKDKNVPLINQMLALRNKIALRLGYKSWADFQIEVCTAKSSATAQKFINDLSVGLQPKFAAEVADLQKMKAAETHDPHATIETWDWRYYCNQRNKQELAFDSEALRNFFPFQKVRDGMFAIFARTLGLKFEQIVAPYKWTDNLELWIVSDSATSEPLGLIYLDLFPHEGKPNPSGHFEIISGKLLPDGKYQRPVVAVLYNFPAPTVDKPSLLSHGEVEIFFHEFGHALHSVLTRAKYARFAGTNVPRDFVEAPSQMLQYWVWDKNVLDTFAADYRDPSKKIPADTIDKMKAARRANTGIFYRRQCAFASLDLALHGAHPENQPYDCVAISNKALEKVFLPIDRSTTFVSGFRGLDGYDAAYYGYAWSDAIAADMAAVFEKSKDGYLDQQTGLRLRHDIYDPGGSRDITLSIQEFLGRKQSIQPFLKKIGIDDAK